MKRPCSDPACLNVTPIKPEEERVSNSGGERRQYPFMVGARAPQ